MSRDQMLQLLRRCEKANNQDSLEQMFKLDADIASAIAWLERLPAGCELAGVWIEDAEPRAKMHIEYGQTEDGEHSLGTFRKVNPDDLTKAGEKEWP